MLIFEERSKGYHFHNAGISSGHRNKDSLAIGGLVEGSLTGILNLNGSRAIGSGANHVPKSKPVRGITHKICTYIPRTYNLTIIVNLRFSKIKVIPHQPLQQKGT